MRSVPGTTQRLECLARLPSSIGIVVLIWLMSCADVAFELKVVAVAFEATGTHRAGFCVSVFTPNELGVTA